MRISRMNPPRLATLFFLSFLACSSSDRTDMILADVDLTDVQTASFLRITVEDANRAPLKTQTFATPTLSAGVAKIALAQPAGMSGSVFVEVIALADDGQTELGKGTSTNATPVTRGKNVGPIAVKVTRTVATPDGGEPGTTDGGAPDSLMRDLGTQLDLPDAGPDAGSDSGSATKLDVQPGLADAADDGAIKTDIATAGDTRSDRGFDAPTPDSAVHPDTPAVTPDAPVDVMADTPQDTGRDGATNILGSLNSCKRYLHFPDTAMTCPPGNTSLNQQNVIVNTTAFTPDGKYLVTAASNSWVKFWKVVDTGLEDTNLIFQGDDFRVTAAISPAGDILALANPSGDVALYDLNAAIRPPGTVSQVGILSASKLSSSPYGTYNWAFFTSDGKQLVVLYPTKGTLSKAVVALWDLATRTLLRELDYDNPNWPFTVTNSPSTGPIWAVLGADNTVDTEGGSYVQTTITLVDVSGSSPVKPTFVIPGILSMATFSPDNLTLATGTEEGEVSLWDLSNKSDIQRFGSPLVAAGTVDDTVYGLAYSRDAQFLAVGSYSGPSTMRLIDLKTKPPAVVQRTLPFEPWSFGFAPDGTTWAYGVGGCAFFYFCKN